MLKKKNLTIFKFVMEINRILSFVCKLFLSKWKDRASMLLTLEEERILKGTRGISNQQVSIYASKKNLTIFKLVIQIYRILSFVCKLSYQSGKDRSGFDFRGGRILKETCGILISR
uniref:Uncharacterized protein n=1 Tax=Meloidogyne enterolobii TaxID=390850 RepID=A0A6V7Y4A2_MELEN|nr:unnamed protein product [Meloidogyne enterolobii]